MEDDFSAIIELKTRLEQMLEGNSGLGMWQDYLAICLSSSYERTGNLQDLVTTIARLEEAVEITPENYTAIAGQLRGLEIHLNDVRMHLNRLYESTENLQDLEAAIARSEEAVEGIPEDHPNRAQWLSSLGSFLHSRYERTGNLQDLEAAIARSEAAVEATPGDHPDRARSLNNLGSHLSSRYERTGNLQDLEAAISRSEAAVEATPEYHPDRAGRLSNLGKCFSSRYERTGNLQDLQAAIARSEAAVEATPEDHPDRAGLLNILGGHLRIRYERTGDLQDLEAAISQSKAAVEATPEDHPDQAWLLNNLGSHLSSRYERTGNPQDLEAAIARSEAAVEATPEDHPNLAAQLSNLGNHLSRRYKRTGNLQDLEAAIARSEAAVEATPEDHPDRAGRLNNLGSRLSSRYERTGNLQDLEAAIARSEAAVEATPEDHPDRAGWLNNFGLRLSSRYERTGNLQDLEAAIARSEAAVEATPEDHPDRAGWLNNFGLHLSSRYERTGNLQDLEAAIARSVAAVEATPQDHPSLAIQLNNFGSYLSSRYERTGNLQHLQATLDAWLTSWNIVTAPILIRIQAAQNAALVLVFSPLMEDLSRACSLLRSVVYLMPLATPRSLEREDQQYILEKLTGLVSLAASVSLAAGESPLEALQLLELGRSVTNGQLLDYRSDISDLMTHYPTLAQDFDFLRQELDSPLSSQELDSSPFLFRESISSGMSMNSTRISMNERLQAQQSTIRRRNKIAQDLDDILVQIRQQPGFENFLRAESEAYLLSAAQEGPIVVLNVTKLRSDAILVTKAELKHIALPLLSHDLMMKHYNRSIDTNDNEVKRELLEWLWKAAVQPVLRKLGYYPKEVDPLPRIWWIGVGVMAKAPIHAAAKFKKGRIHMATLQYCLPSYTSTIRYL